MDLQILVAQEASQSKKLIYLPEILSYILTKTKSYSQSFPCSPCKSIICTLGVSDLRHKGFMENITGWQKHH